MEGVQYLPEEWSNAMWISIKDKDITFQAKNGARYFDGNLKRRAKGYIITQ